MARADLKGNIIVIVCKGKTYNTGILVDPKQPGQIAGRVRRAIAKAKGLAASDAHFEEISKLQAEAEAARIKQLLGIGGKKAAPRKGRRRGARRPRAAVPKERPRPRAAAERAKAKPRPSITLAWIGKQLQNSARGDTKANAAADALHANRAYVSQFLQKGNRAAATAEVFNTLYAIPRFRLYLGSRAASRNEFAALQLHLSGTKGRLSPSAPGDIITAADMYIRDYVLLFSAHPSGGNPLLRMELSAIPGAKGLLDRLDSIRDGVGTRKDKLDRMYAMLKAPMDADTITASALYARRWHLANPRKGKGKSQAEIAQWNAPEAPREEGAAEPALKTPLDEFAEKNWKNLSSDIFNAVKRGSPAGLVLIMTRLPGGHSSLDMALKALKRDDIERAFEKVFNEHLKNNKEFLAYLLGNSAYRTVGRPATLLSSASRPEDRKKVTLAIQMFLNDAAKKDKKLAEDFKLLFGKVLKLDRDRLMPDGKSDMRTMTAAALYAWRKDNRDKPVGEWAKVLGIKQAQPKKHEAPPPVQQQEKPGTRRRKTMNL